MAKKNDKSSKTAHVLNLITSPAEKAAQKAAAEAETNLPEVDETTDSSAAGFASEAAEAAAVNQQAAQVHQPLIPPILQVAHRHDESLAEQIRGALEEELAPELAEAAAIQQPQQPAPQPKAAPEPEPAPVQEPEPLPVQPEPAPMPQPAPEPEQPQFKLPASAIVSSFTIPEPPPLPPLRPPPCRETWWCSPRPAPPSTSSRTSWSGARSSSSWSTRCRQIRRRSFELRKNIGHAVRPVRTQRL